MKKNILIATALLITGCLFAADADNKDTVKSAAKKLSDAGYSWKSTTENANGGGGGRGGGPAEGKIDKNGVMSVTMGGRNGASREVLIKGDKVAIKGDDGWQTPEERAQAAGNGGGGRGARGFQNMKAPAARIEAYLDDVKSLQSADGVYSGELTDEGAKKLIVPARGRGGNGNAPEVSEAKGSIKFWVKDGVLSKIQYNVQGKVSRNGQDRDVDRTTTIEFNDVGTTKVEVPDDAAKKLQ